MRISEKLYITNKLVAYESETLERVDVSHNYKLAVQNSIQEFLIIAKIKERKNATIQEAVPKTQY